MIDLANLSDRRAVIAQMYADLELASQSLFADAEPRTYMGASVIGDDCRAKIWGDFRWLSIEKFTGQKLRLFNRGHLEEARFAKLLKAIGFDLREFDEHGEQYGLKGCDGHFGGHLDGMAKPPARYGIAGDLVLLVEEKSHNEKSFKKLAGDKNQDASYNLLLRQGGEGMRLSKPQHYAQMACYGRAYKLQFGLYVAVNKETDEIYFEIIELDWRYADDLFLKAQMLIKAQTMPQKIAQTETFWKCKGCSQSPVCHRGVAPPKSCRSCVYALAAPEGKWICSNDIYAAACDETELSKEFMKVGCEHWAAIV